MCDGPSGSVAAPVQLTASGANPACGVLTIAFADGARLACTTIVSEALAEPPRPSETVTVAVRVAAARYDFVGFCSVDVVASPKSHAYVSVSPSGSLAVAVNAIGTPTRTFPV